MQDTADAAGTFPREVRRVGRRYLQRGLEAALSEDPRPKPLPKFDARSEAAVVAIACSPPPPGHVWEPLLMSDGNVLLASAFGASLDVIDQTTHMVTKRYGTKQMPDAATLGPNFFAEFEMLPNGNIITSNWQGYGPGNGGMGIQVIEFNPAGAVVWFYKQDPAIFSSIQGVMVLDGKDPRYLHVQEISTDSTWQPVIPTP